MKRSILMILFFLACVAMGGMLGTNPWYLAGILGLIVFLDVAHEAFSLAGCLFKVSRRLASRLLKAVGELTGRSLEAASALNGRLLRVWAGTPVHRRLLALVVAL